MGRCCVCIQSIGRRSTHPFLLIPTILTPTNEHTQRRNHEDASALMACAAQGDVQVRFCVSLCDGAMYGHIYGRDRSVINPDPSYL